MNGPTIAAPPLETGPWEEAAGAAAAAAAAVPITGITTIDGAAGAAAGDLTGESAVVWRERERRQRTIRVLMMGLLMLLIMDGDEQAAANNRRNNRQGLRGDTGKRKKNSKGSLQTLGPAVFASRAVQEKNLNALVVPHARYQALVAKNGGVDHERAVTQWSTQQAEQEKDLFAAAAANEMSNSKEGSADDEDPEVVRKVFHYPWNTTGFYRGEWTRANDTAITEAVAAGDQKPPDVVPKPPVRVGDAPDERHVLDAVALEKLMLEAVQKRNEQLGIFLLPRDTFISLRDDHNFTSMHWEEKTVDATGKMFEAVHSDAFETTAAASDIEGDVDTLPQVTLTHDNGHAAFQLYSRSIPSMKELSLVDGFVKLYDSTSAGYSTRKDILLRVRGVLIHSIGKLSLVTNGHLDRSALVIGNGSAATITTETRRRRLQAALANIETADEDAVREDAVALFADAVSGNKHDSVFMSPGMTGHEFTADTATEQRVTETKTSDLQKNEPVVPKRTSKSDITGAGNTTESIVTLVARKTTELTENASSSDPSIPRWSDIVLPYPFVRDDTDESIRRVKTPAARRMPAREQKLEANAASCEFEISFDVEETEWTIGEWRTLLGHRIEEVKRLNQPSDAATENGETRATASVPKKSKPPQDQALVMNMIGSIHSPNCNFTAALNATAIRTDWEATTNKAINYSFYMMLVCLTQIMILLRQLLHSQAQSAATRVSLLTIGWQTMIDALICLTHIYFSLVMQPLFTAFASVAFFKLLIFCVIEMKYMAIIIQARNNNNGGQSTEVLRRQIAMLHLRFYGALFGTLFLMYYFFDDFRAFFMLVLYSFWVPQIVMNIVTEAKNAMHVYYIYGMSLTRLFVPLYIFALQGNFLREVWPDSKTDVFTCQLVILWVGIQTAVLIAQGKYGARFMIPARCLPPKFNYSRPLPAAMLPPGALDIQSTDLMDGSSLNKDSESQALLSDEATTRGRGRHTTAVTTRNRIRGKRVNRNGMGESGMTSETLDSIKPCSPAAHTLDCSICYDSIDVRDRPGYMLAPCDHIFHRDCLVQWMDVKLECPVCRTELPAL